MATRHFLVISSSENQFVVPPLGGIVWRHGMDMRPTIPPKGGTTNCAFHYFRASQRDMKAPRAIHCHSLPFIAIHCHSLPFIAIHCHSLIDAGSVVRRSAVTIRQRKMKGQEHSAHTPDKRRIRTYSITTSS